MQVLVHVPVLEGIVSGFLGGVDRGVEVLELRGEAHADFERIGHNVYNKKFCLQVYIEVHLEGGGFKRSCERRVGKVK